MPFSIRKAALRFCFYLSLPLILSTPLSAAEIVLEPQIGFHGLFQLGRPFPLRVDLTNLGRPVEGTLEVKVWKGGAARGLSPYALHYRRELFLSAQSRKSVQFTVDPDSVSRPLAVSFSAPGINLSEEVDLRRHFSPFPLVLLLTESSVAPPIPLPSGSSTPLISVSAGHLPSDARAYHGVSAVIVYEQSLRDLSRAQTMALEKWLSSGGSMVVLGSIHYALYQEPSMSRFLPVRVMGMKRFSSLPALERLYGEKASPLRDLWVQDSRLVEGRILVEEKGTPIVAETSRGRGRLLYLSLDAGRPPLSRWGGLPLLFRDLLPSAAERGPTLDASWDEGVFSQLLLSRSFISTYVPVISFFLWLLFYLGGLAFLVWLWQRRHLPRRSVALSFLAFVVLSSLGGYLQFARGGNIPDGVLLSSTLLEALADGYVEAQSNVALFSTQSRPYSLRIESGWSDLEPVAPRPGKSEDGALVVQEEGDATRFRFPLREWDYRLFKVRSVGRFPLRAEVEGRGDKVVLKLANLTAYDLTECWLVASGQAFFLGDLLQGASQIREFSLSREPSYGAGRQPARIDLREISFKDKMREALFRYSFFPQDRGLSAGAPAGTAAWGGSAALFFGWVKGASRRVWADDARLAAYDYTLFRAIFPLGEED